MSPDRTVPGGAGTDRQSLRASLDAQLFEFVPDPVFLLDADGVFLDLNEATARYLDDVPERLIGRCVTDLFPAEQARRQLRVIREVISTGEPFVEERVTPIGQETFIFQYLLRRIEVPGRDAPMVLGMIRDVTGLLALERQYLELYEKATDSLFAIDTDGRIRALNREAESMSGYSREALESLHFSEVIPAAEVERLRRYFDARVAGKGAPTQYEVRYLHADGEERWAEVHIAEEASSLGAFQASVRDITARKRLEAMRRDFLDMVSHDVKAPVTVIQGFANAMASGLYGQTTAEQTECLGRIVGASRRVRHLMEQFLLAEQLDDDVWTAKAGPVSAALDRAQAAVNEEAEAKGVELDVCAGDTGGLRIGDAEGLGCVLENLLSNALKFTGAGGRVTVRASREEGSVKVEVTDTGAGIPESELGRVFDRFFRASNSGGTEGSGLGLYIVRRIVERAGGRVAVASGPGEGTRFTVRLPVAEP